MAPPKSETTPSGFSSPAFGIDASKFWTGGSEAGKAAFAEFQKMFTELKMPAMPNMEALLVASRRNMEVLSAANKVALEGAQTVARRHMEIIQQTVAELSTSLRTMSALDSPQVKAAKQTELVKESYQHAVANFKEISDLIQHANGEAIGMLNQRVAEAMDEWKSLLEKPAAKP